MEIIETNFNEAVDLVTNMIKTQKEGCVYCISDEPCAIIGYNNDANFEEIKKRNIRFGKINHQGGTIIASPGDIQIGILTKGYTGHEYRNNIINDIVKKIKENNYDAKVVGNDILINGKKVIGFGSRMFGNILFTAIQVSININLNLIKAICTKPMGKMPDGLINYGIDTQDILNILFDIIPH